MKRLKSFFWHIDLLFEAIWQFGGRNLPPKRPVLDDDEEKIHSVVLKMKDPPPSPPKKY